MRWLPAACLLLFLTSGWSDPLIVLHLTVGAAAIVYFALRNDEGDFRALLCVAIALFLAGV